jgi:septal ring factor EnvC (AmiA/AmiB activator)
MNKMRVILAVTLFAGVLAVSGCTSNASEEEMRQLQNLRQEISSLRSQVSAKQQEVNDLKKQIADRDDRLKQCQADQEEAKKALGK